MKIESATLRRIIKEELEYYYSDLGLRMNPTGDQKIIKKAYRKQAMKTHPDKGGNEEEFKKVNTAYTVLSDEEKKGQLDKALLSQALKTKKENPQAKFDGTTGMPLSDEIISIFKDMVGIQSDQSDGSSNSGNDMEREFEKQRQFFDLKEKIYDAVSKKAMEKIKQNQFEHARTFMERMKEITAAKTVEDLKDYMGFIK